MQRPPISHRKGIPFFHDKTELEYQQDIYERYHEMVVRQSALHIADELWDGYPFQPVFDFAEKYYPKTKDSNILEIGCGVGRWIASLAKRFPNSAFWGIDYSYQMLKRANKFWVEGTEILIDISDKGLGQLSQQGERLENLQFGLAKAEDLPFDDNSQDMIVSSFLLDRLDDPKVGLREMYRVLKPNGRLIVVSPLNFKKAEHWDMYYPASQLSQLLKEMNFAILNWKEDILVHEPLDGHENSLSWKCLGFVVVKNS